VKVGDLVRGTGLLGDVQTGLVVEAGPDEHDFPGHWVLFFEDPCTWKWYSDDERGMCERNKVKVLSEGR